LVKQIRHLEGFWELISRVSIQSKFEVFISEKILRRCEACANPKEQQVLHHVHIAELNTMNNNIFILEPG